MFDLKAIRDNPAAFDKGLERRGLAPLSASLLKLDETRRAHVTRLQEAQARRNAASKDVGRAKAAKDDATAQRLMAEVAGLKDLLATGEDEEKRLTTEIEAALSVIPNLPRDDVPDGADETGNQLVRKAGTPRTFQFKPKQHFEIGEALGLMDFEAAARISGARFVVLKGGLARLERALGAFMLDIHTSEFGYTEVAPPMLVRDHAANSVTSLEKFRDQLFGTTDGFWLIPTSEVSLTNLVREQILDEAALPQRYTACTPCFRSEAGAAGKDTRGMIRQHQFTKVELVSITTPETALAEHERMTRAAETILERLELPYRTMLLCTGDMGFAAQKTYDIEVWLPGQDAYREISSCSVCGDFQARRMGARYRPSPVAGASGRGHEAVGQPKSKQEPRYVHTLNGSGLAVGRTLVAILENYQQADGTVAIPEALRPYMGAKDRIAKG